MLRIEWDGPGAFIETSLCKGKVMAIHLPAMREPWVPGPEFPVTRLKRD
jgi:hypothetical protein